MIVAGALAGRRVMARRMPLTAAYPEQIPRIIAERIVAKTIVVRIRLFTVAELTNWGFTLSSACLMSLSQRPVVQLCLTETFCS